MAGLYIHVPFCKKLCNYCDFYHLINEKEYDSYIEAIIKEAEIRKEYTGNEKISTIYFGGGTPSVLSEADLDKILKNIKRVYGIDADCEITIEANPDDITSIYSKSLKKMGFNRISLGIQSWDDEDLKMLNRRHSAAQAEEAINLIMGSGFENVTIDLIYGLPGMTTEKLARNLDRSFSFPIKHLSAYHLTIEPGTVFGKMKSRGQLTEIDEEESVAEFNLLIEKAESAGFIHYEISNFGRPGYFSIHNTNYWRQVPYIGLGPSAHSFNGFSRQWNLKDLKRYIKSVKTGKTFFEREELTQKSKFNEYIMTSLRTMWGADLEYIEKTFEKEGYDYVVNLSGKFINYGMMRRENKNLVLTNQGKMISDNIITEFMMP